MAVTKYLTGSGEPRWRVEWRLPGRVKRRKVFRTAREARAFEAQVVGSKARGEHHDPRAGTLIPVEYAYSAWMVSRSDLSPKVRRGYQDCWRLSVQPEFGSWPVGSVDRRSVQEWVNAMRDVGPRTQRWRHTVLRLVMEYAVSEGWVVRNPCASTTFPPLRDRDHVYLTSAEVERLAVMCGEQGDVVLVLAYTGLRFGELTGLRIGDIDLESRRLRVRRSITQVGGKLVEGPPKTRSGVRVVPLPARIVPVLQKRIEGRSQSAPAITSPRGALLSRENWVRAVRWNAQRETLGHPRLRIHDLRHTYASLARSAGADLRLLQRTLGHSSITTTAHVYSHLFTDDLDAVADALDRISGHSINTAGNAEHVGPLAAHSEGPFTIDDELDEHENQD